MSIVSISLGPAGERVETKTYLAMEEVFVKSVTDSADPTFVTVVDGFVDVVAPQLADTTVVLRCTFATVYTSVRCLL